MKKTLCLSLLLLVFLGIGAQSVSETLYQLESTRRELTENQSNWEQRLLELGRSNPLFAKQDPFESDYDYLARYSQAKPEIDRLRKQYLGDLLMKLDKLRAKTWETTNLTVKFGKYDANSQIWELSVQHQDYQKEKLECKVKVDRLVAKTINDNQPRLLIKGILTVDLSDRIGLAKLQVRDPVTSAELIHDFHPVLRLGGQNCGFSQDGRLVAVRNGKKAWVYDIETGKAVLEFSSGYFDVSRATLSPDNRFMAIVQEGNAVIYSLEGKQAVAEYGGSNYIRTIALSQDGKFLAIGGGDAKAWVFNLETSEQIAEFMSGYNSVIALAFSPDGKFLVIGNDYNGAHLFDLETRQLAAEFKHQYVVESVSFSPDGKFLATGCGDNRARVFDLATKKEVSSFEYGRFVSWSPVGSYLACSGSGKTQIINIATGDLHYLYDVEGTLAFSPDGRFLAIGDAIYRTFITAEGAEPEKSISRPPQLAAKVELTEPSGNKFLDALEKGSLKISVSNSGQGDGVGLTVKLEPSKIAGLNYLNGFIAQIPAGKTIDLDIPLEAYIEVADGTHTLNISFEEANGFPPTPLQLTFSTRAYKRPEFLISEVGIDDSNKNGKIEAGEMIQLTIRIRNKGQGPANGAYAKFYAGENVFITDQHAKTQSMGELKPGQSVDLQLEIFINERCLNDIPLYVDFTEATGLAGVSKLRLPISKSDATRQISKVVVSGVEESYNVNTPAPLKIDVEQNIPSAKQPRTSDYAVIFGVEQYPSPTPRAIYAVRDATWFKEYAAKTLGIPQANIYFKTNESVTKNEFDKVFGRTGWLDLRVSAESRVYFFFSGHGIPSQTEGKAYILPYDGDPNYAPLTAYPLQDVYDGLSRLKSAQNLVFLDACFTGMARENHPLYASARPVFLAPEELASPKKVNVLSASESKQMSNAWPEKQHGLFSYFLLKGMQGSADANQDKRLTLAELQAYLIKEVPPQAARLDKEQVPQFSGKSLDEVLIEY